MRVIMTGGGTGGHIYPAIAIADKIKKKNPSAEIIFVGTTKGMEKDIVPESGYEIKFITVSGFNRKNLLKNFKTMKDLLQGDKESRKILDDFKPDIVIGTGGYVCGPVVRAAHKKGIKTYIHEQNASPGMTNKLLEKYVDKIFLSFPEGIEHFKMADKIIVTGNPIRKSFLVSSSGSYREKFNIEESDFVVLCFGGSLGAGNINKVMLRTLLNLKDEKEIKVFFITGKPYFEPIKEALQEMGLSNSENVTLLPYADNIHEYMIAADLIISRSGALTVSEITACGKAAILVPSPNVTGNHQYFNAKVVADKGGAILIEDKDFTQERLFATIKKLQSKKEIIDDMGKAASKIGRTDAVDVIYDNLGIE